MEVEINLFVRINLKSAFQYIGSFILDVVWNCCGKGLMDSPPAHIFMLKNPKKKNFQICKVTFSDQMSFSYKSKILAPIFLAASSLAFPRLKRITSINCIESLVRRLTSSLVMSNKPYYELISCQMSFHALISVTSYNSLFSF